MEHPKKVRTLFLFLFICTVASPVWADLTSDIQQLQKRWAQVNYQLEGKAQLTAFERLIEDATRVSQKHPASAQTWIWSGIIKSTYAGIKGGFGALKLAKASKADLEHAIELNPEALNGSAYTSLGTLYFSVPGWPLGFGDDNKAEELLLQALAIDPVGIDNNYFYGNYLHHEGRYAEAKKYFLNAQSAPKRPNRPLADAGRQKEISAALDKLLQDH